jgi:hypothetical protein
MTTATTKGDMEMDGEEALRKQEEDTRARVERLKREYGHLSPEEFNRKVAEDERRSIQEDPRYIAVVRQGERERAARKAEVEQRRQQQEKQREAEAKAQLAAEKERQKRIWVAAGNPIETFEQMWPEIREEVLLEKRRAFLERGFDSVV